MDMKKYIVNCRLKQSLMWLALSVFSIVICMKLFGLDLDMLSIAKALVITLFFIMHGFTINNHFDRKADIHNPKKIKMNPVASGLITKTQSVAQCAILAAIAIAMTYLTSPESIIIIIALLLNSALYSMRFKSVPIIDMISHSIIVFSIATIPLFILGISAEASVIFFFMFLGISNVAELQNQIQDYAADKNAGINTTAVRFGLPFARKLIYLSELITAGVIVYMWNFLNQWSALTLLLIPIFDIAAQKSKTIEKYHNKINVAIVSAFLLLSFLL